MLPRKIIHYDPFLVLSTANERRVSRYTLTNQINLKLFLLLFVALCSIGQIEAKEKKRILIINSATFDELWTAKFYDYLHENLTNEGHIVSQAELMVPAMKTEEDANEKREMLLRKHSQKPDMVVIIGDPGWVVCRPLFDSIWKDTPTIITYGQKEIPNNTMTLLQFYKPNPGSMIPIQEVQQKYNVTSILYPFYAEETIRLMKRMLPRMSRIVFISDQRYISICIKKEISRIVNETFPELTLTNLETSNITTEELLNTISLYDQTVGVIYYSWFIPANGQERNYLDENAQKIISAFSKTPVFTLTDRKEYVGDFLGGYYISVKNYGKHTIERILEVLGGTSAREIPISTPNKPAIYLNYPHLQSHGIAPSLYPKDASYINAPPSFFEEHGLLIVFIGAVGLLTLGGTYLRLRLYLQRQRQKEKEIALLLQYRRLIDSMPLIYVHLQQTSDSDYLFKEVNSSFEEVFDCDRKKILHHTLNELSATYPSLNKLRHTGNQHDVFTIINKNGEERHFDRISFHLKEENEIELFCIDHTEEHNAALSLEKNSELLKGLNDKYQLVLQATRMVPWTLDLISQRIEAKQLLATFDIKHNRLIPISRTNGNKCYAPYIHPDDFPLVNKAFNSLINGETTVLSKEYRCKSFTGSNTENYYWATTNAIIAKRDENGIPTSIVGATLNINERKKLEHDLIKAKEVAEDSDRLKSAFIANMSHEIRTPLNAIIGFSEMLASTEETDERDEYIKMISANNSLLLQLINDVLDLSMIEAGMFELKYEVVDLFGMLCEREEKWRLKNTNPNVEIVFDKKSGHCETKTDSIRLIQVLENLLSNAIKFTQTGSIHFGYKVLLKENRIEYYVSDTGCGIPHEELKTIFNRFVKLDNFVQGTGLGLSICQKIIEKMGGTIRVDSELGKGSTFKFCIPDTKPDT